jgi:hypothetical protein
VRLFVPQADEIETKVVETLDFASPPPPLCTGCPHENMLHRGRTTVIIMLQAHNRKMCLYLSRGTYSPDSESSGGRDCPSQCVVYREIGCGHLVSNSYLSILHQML